MTRLEDDPLLRQVPVVEGFKLLDPVALYAKLGEGGMGAVYHGRHLNLGVDVAVKCLNIQGGVGDACLARFEREARVAAEISSENLVRVYDVREKYGLHYLIMEFVLGESLRGRVARKGPLDVAEALSIAAQSARGLDAAHSRGIVHRDVKPDNILISRDGVVKVADLGLAKAADAIDSLVTGSHAMMGTPQYMPPEQFGAAADVGPPADVYGLGATLYFLLAGKNPFGASTLPELMKRVCTDPFPSILSERADVPDRLLELMDRATDKDPARRHRDAREFLDDVHEVLAILGGPAFLADDEAGVISERSLISPPPAEVVSAMRRALVRSESHADTRGTTQATSTEGATSSGTDAHPSTVDQVLPAPPHPLVRLAGIAAGIALLVGAVFGARKAWPDLFGGDGKLVAMLDRGIALAREDAGLGAAIEQFRAILEKEPGHPAARAALADALARLAADRLRSGALADALDAATEAVRYDDSQRNRDRIADIERRMEEELRQGIQLLEPEPGAVVTEAPERLVCALEFRHREITGVSVNGEDLGAREGRFTVPAPDLVQGENEVTIRVDAEGTQAERTFSFALDSEPPVIADLAPKQGAVVPVEWVLSGRVEDASAVLLTLDGEPIPVDPDNRFRATVRDPGGLAGHDLVATDRFGLKTRRRIEVRVDDQPPSVALRGPTKVVAPEGRYSFEAEVTDDNGARELRCGDAPFVVPGDGLVQGEIALARGENRLSFVAYDEAGNASAPAEVFVVFDDEDPVVHVETPREGAEVPEGPLVISGTCRDLTECVVTCGGGTKPVANDRFEIATEVSGAGLLELELRVADAAENEVVVPVRVVVRPPCLACGGGGRCATCEGQGHAVCEQCHGTLVIQTPCNACKGSGCGACKGARSELVSCGTCGGAGTAPCANPICNRGKVPNPFGKGKLQCPMCKRGKVPCAACGRSGKTSVPCACVTTHRIDVPCQQCGGTGGQQETCRACRNGRSRALCPACAGVGACDACDGTGLRPVR